MIYNICRRLLLVVLCIVLVAGCCSAPAYAAADSIGKVDAMEHLEGDSKYVASKYRDYYHLDIEETGLLDMVNNIFNSLANMLFSVITLLGALAVNIFYQAMAFDAGALFVDQLDAIQAALKSSVFDSFFVLALCGTFWILAKKLMRRDLAGMIVELGKVLFVVILSYFVVTNSAVVLSGATGITKAISTAALADINNAGSNTDDYAATASGLIWKSLVHDPWGTLEFGQTVPSETDVDAFMTTAPNSDARVQLVKDYQTAHKSEDSTIFAKNLGIGRLGFLIVYLIPFIIKAVLYMLMAVLQIGYQLMAVLYVILAPVILLLALLPSFGIDLISGWAKKLLETQIMILILTFLIGLILKFDNILYSLSGSYGWLVVLVLETFVAIFVVMNYKTIMGGLGKINKAVRQPASARYELMRAGDVTQMSTRSMATLGKGARSLSNKARSTADSAMTRFRNRERLEYDPADYETVEYEPEEDIHDNTPPAKKGASKPEQAPDDQDTPTQPVRRKIGFDTSGPGVTESKVPRPATTDAPASSRTTADDKSAAAPNIERPVTVPDGKDTQPVTTPNTSTQRTAYEDEDTTPPITRPTTTETVQGADRDAGQPAAPATVAPGASRVDEDTTQPTTRPTTTEIAQGATRDAGQPAAPTTAPRVAPGAAHVDEGTTPPTTRPTTTETIQGAARDTGQPAAPATAPRVAPGASHVDEDAIPPATRPTTTKTAHEAARDTEQPPVAPATSPRVAPGAGSEDTATPATRPVTAPAGQEPEQADLQPTAPAKVPTPQRERSQSLQTGQNEGVKVPAAARGQGIAPAAEQQHPGPRDSHTPERPSINPGDTDSDTVD